MFLGLGILTLSGPMLVSAREQGATGECGLRIFT
jgi:hypothetical protein